MTVVGTNSGEVYCAWFKDGEPKAHKWPPGALEKVGDQA